MKMHDKEENITFVKICVKKSLEPFWALFLM